MGDEILTISEAAEYLGVFRLTIRNWEKKGKLKCFRTLGGHRRFKKSDLDAIVHGTDSQQKEKHRHINILIVDDEKMVQELLSKFLKGRGYNTLLASNGKEALAKAQENDVHLAIVDIKMPGLIDGLQVLKNIKKLKADTQVIIITGFGTEKTRDLSNRLGAYAYVEKPFDLEDMKIHVDKALKTYLPT